MAIRVVLVYNPSSTLDSLRDIVDAEQDMVVVAEAGDGCSAVRLAIDMKPEILVMGLLFPGMNAIEATRKITKDHNETRVVIIGKYNDKFIIDQVIEAALPAICSEKRLSKIYPKPSEPCHPTLTTFATIPTIIRLNPPF